MASQGDSTICFIVKNLAAEELHLNTGSVRSLGDLRLEVRVRWNLPFHEQRMVCAGRSSDGRSDSYPMSCLLRGTENHEERIVWLLWMRDEDYCLLDGGCLFMRNMFAAKRLWCEERGVPFDPVTLRSRRAVGADSVSRYESYRSWQNLDDDEGNYD